MYNVNNLLKSDFYYVLPEELIAQSPIEPRDNSRLMVLDRKSGLITNDHFYNLASYLNQGDLVVMNDSKVFPARLFGEKLDSGIPVEFILIEQKGDDIWETMVRPGRRLKKGSVVSFPQGLSAKIIETTKGGNRIVKLCYDGDFYALLEKIGNMPVPPYITKTLTDNSRYNTVYADKTGSIAAPTAGLHFTNRVFDSLKAKGIETAKITLHVGIGTFRPVKAERINDHKMHFERFFLPYETIVKINECKKRGGRVISVGTTSCRTLESNGDTILKGDINPYAKNKGAGIWSKTDMFITPGYNFKVVDSMITNFHLPESTLLMLISAFAEREMILNAYKAAIDEKYRFFSFGDSMLIV